MNGKRKIYLAGKIWPNCWRHRIVSGLRSAIVTGDGSTMHEWPILEGAISGLHDYVGPFFVSCDHGCAHGLQSHGVALSSDLDREPLLAKSGAGEFSPHYSGCIDIRGVYGAYDGLKDRQKSVMALCLEAIDRCDLFFAWIDQTDCFGSIAELGYAVGAGKRTVAACKAPFADMWFPYTIADECIVSPSPEWALACTLANDSLSEV